MALGVGQLVPGHAVDGLIFADVDVVGILGDIQIGAVGNVSVVLVLAGSGDDDLADLLGFRDGLLGPCAGLDVNGLAVLHEVHGDHGELQRRAALNKQDLIVVGDAHEVAQILLGLVDDLLENRGTVAHFHDAHAAAAVVHHLVADLLQNGLRHHCGTGGEIECTTIFHDSLPPERCVVVEWSCFLISSIYLPYQRINPFLKKIYRNSQIFSSPHKKSGHSPRKRENARKTAGFRTPYIFFW